MSDTEQTGAHEPDERPGGRRAGCLAWAGRLLAALLVVLMAAAVALVALVALALQLGYDLGTPRRVGESVALAATADAQARALQTEVADLRGRSAGSEGAIDQLEQQVTRLEAQSEQFAQSSEGIATALAEVRGLQLQVGVFATAEAERAETLDAIERRSERIERFLQRLSDITSDTNADLATPTPRARPTSSPTSEPTVTTTLTASARTTPVATPTRTPTP